MKSNIQDPALYHHTIINAAKFVWDSELDPNIANIRAFIRKEKFKSMRNSYRNRFNTLLSLLYNHFGVKSLDKYTTNEIIDVFWEINAQLNKRRLAKEAIRNLLCKYFDFNKNSYSEKLKEFKFESGIYTFNRKDNPNQIFVSSYLKDPKNQKVIDRERRIIGYCLDYLAKNYEERSILTYSAIEFRELFNSVEKKQVNRSEKTRYMISLKKFINSIIKPLIFDSNLLEEYEQKFNSNILPRNREYLQRNYDKIFSRDYFVFTDSQRKKNKKNYLKPSEYLNFLKEVREIYKNNQDYFIFSLFMSSCRWNGLHNLKVKDIHFENNFFDTMDKSKWSRYFFIEHLGPELRAYILQKRLNPNNLLFPKIGTKSRIINKRLKEIYQKKYRCHDFRRSILRLWKRARMSQGDRNVLSNHAKETTDEFYTCENPWDEPEIANKLYQDYMKFIFFGGSQPVPNFE